MLKFLELFIKISVVSKLSAALLKFTISLALYFIKTRFDVILKVFSYKLGSSAKNSLFRFIDCSFFTRLVASSSKFSSLNALREIS